MIHVFIGTKAQYVKTAPVLRELDKRGISYNLIDSGQHADISRRYRTFFELKEPDVTLTNSTKDITTVVEFILWFLSFFFKIIFQPGKIGKKLFNGKKGICLIHGDTPTTLLSLFAAKRCGIKVAHLESGLRSYNFINPFPEEIIRIITMHFSDYLFAPSTWAYENLLKMNIRGECININGNTNIDALHYISTKAPALPDAMQKHKTYAVVSIHRAETILNRGQLKKVLTYVIKISRDIPLFFCVHPPTKKALLKWDLYESLVNTENIEVHDLLPYPQFIELVKRAQFIITDGGSIQEESYYLNIPCLVMRKYTERIEGLKQNVCISKFDNTIIEHFLKNADSFKRTDLLDKTISPSKSIVDIVLNISGHSKDTGN